MHIIKSVGVLSVAKIMGLLYGCMGLIIAPLFLMMGLMGSALGQQNSPLAGIFGVGFGIGIAVLRRCSTGPWVLSWARLAPCSTTCLPNGSEALSWKWNRARRL